MAIGTSDGEYYPSHLESVLSSLDTSGSTKEPLAPRNAPMEEFRNENEGPAPINPMEMRSKVKVAGEVPETTWAAMVDSFTNPDSKVPTAERMVQGDGNYSKIVDWLTEHGKTPGQEMQNWSTKEKLG